MVKRRATRHDPLHVAMSSQQTLRNSATQVHVSVRYFVDIVTDCRVISG